MSKKEIICTYCHTPIEDVKDDMVICNGCGTPYHKECWDELEVCATYGCNSTTCHNIFDVDFKKHITNNNHIEIELSQSNENNNINQNNTLNKNNILLNKKLIISISLIIILLFSSFFIHYKLTLKYIDENYYIEDGCLKKYCGNEKIVKIPKIVTSIDRFAFLDCKTIKKIIIPNSVNSISYEAFVNCMNLQEIFLPKDISDIYSDEFSRCENLQKININKNNKNYMSVDGVIYNKNLTSIICCPNGKTGTFIIPNTVSNISEDAFSYCFKLQEIIIPNSVINIEQGAFSDCKNIREITIPESVRNIGDYAFWNCKNLQKVIILNGIKNIDLAIFGYCDDLQEITIPESVTNINTGFEFRYHSDFKAYNVSIDNFKYSSINGILYNKEQTKLLDCPYGKKGSIIIPKEVTEITDYAFALCYRITKIELPPNINSIGDHAFTGCKYLKELVIPDKRINIGEDITNKCFNLKTVSLY